MTNQSKWLTEAHRRMVIINAAVELANVSKNGVLDVDHDSVIDRCVIKTSRHTVKRYYPKKTDLWSAVMSHELLREDVRLAAQAIGVE